MSLSDRQIGYMKNQVNEYKQEITRLLNERGEYLRISAHQMKSPLATIMFSIDTLLGDYAGRLNAKQMRIVESIKRSTNELQNLILDILELERFRSGNVSLEPLNFTGLCVQVIDELREKIQGKNIQFKSDIPRLELVTNGNEIGLKHAVHNLIENAVKYSHRDGIVRFSLEYDEKKKIIIMKVQDRGIGISDEAQKHIFEEFYRAPNARIFNKIGTGFGLTIVKQIIKSCGGNVTLRSKENEGTTFIAHLPLKEVKESTFAREKVKRKRIVVIGGVAAGPKAAARARRMDPHAKITVFEKENFLAYFGCALPYYISGKLKNQRDLFMKHTKFESETEYFREVKGIEIRNLCEVTSINRDQMSIECREVLSDRVFHESYDKLIIATGSNPDIPPIQGVNLGNIMVLHGIADSERIKVAIANSTSKDIVILGGGKIGVETAEALTASGGRITIVEKEPEILPFLDPEMAALVKLHLERRGVRIITNETARAFYGKAKVEYVQLSSFKLPTDLVILATGFKPNIDLAKEAGLKIGSAGAISVNQYLQTSDTSIYAAGDCVEVMHIVSGKPVNIPLGSLANRQGRVAGSNAAGKKQKFGPITGTTVIRVFDYNFAKTGLNEREAEKAGFTPVSCYLPDYDRDPFIEEARMIHIKMIADKSTKRLLGVQIVGEGDVAKRVDVSASVIARRGQVGDVISLDLGYTPSYSQAIDTIISAAHVLENKLEGVFRGITAYDTEKVMKLKRECVCIDVRTPQEFEEERIPGFELIPLESLRRRIDEIPPNRSIILACETGVRSYQASLILRANGFKNVSVLEGGLRMWPSRVSRE